MFVVLLLMSPPFLGPEVTVPCRYERSVFGEAVCNGIDTNQVESGAVR
jgi:hypothetical protein